MRRVLPLGSAVIAAALLLGGCSLLSTIPNADPPATTAPTDTGDSTGAPAGFEQLTHCDGAPEQPWVWVDGFPGEEFTSSGAKVDCGDTWPQDDGETFVNITSYEMTSDQIDSFGAALEASGFEMLFDNFVPGTPSGESYYGARDFYLDGVSDGAFTRLAIEIYPADDTDTLWTAYIDYLSPETRAL